ncbi:MAG: hypothetical protein ACI9JN_001314 [Bacteroidia bacterium]|jgi:hypothetical protein
MHNAMKVFLTSFGVGLILLFCVTGSATCQTLRPVQAFSTGDITGDKGIQSASDSEGNIYITGIISGSVNMDPLDSGQMTLHHGRHDAFIQKLNNNGELEWVKTIGGIQEDHGQCIAIDSKEEIIVGGSYSFEVDLDPGFAKTLVSSNGLVDGFLVKLDKNGDLIWAREAKSVNQVGFNRVLTDSQDNIYVSGIFSGEVQLSDGSNSVSLKSQGKLDFFIAKYSASGSLEWAFSLGGAGTDACHSLALTPQNNLVIGGSYTKSIDLDHGTGKNNHTSGDNRPRSLIASYSDNGDFIWGRSFGPMTSSNTVTDIVIDSHGMLYVSGVFVDSMDYDSTGPGPCLKTTSLYTDSYVLKLDQSANLIWARSFVDQFGSPIFISLCLDHDENITICTDFGSIVDLAPGPDKVYAISGPGEAVFVVTLNPNGYYVNSVVFGGGYRTSPTPMHIEWTDSNTLMVVGSFFHSMNLTKWTRDSFLSKGAEDYFFVRIKKCSNQETQEFYHVCDSLKWHDGVTYFENTNEPTYAFKNSDGCDSIIRLNLLIANNEVDTQTACDSFQWINGLTYFRNNDTATHILKSSLGCDSVVTLNLWINSTVESTQVVAACDSFLWIDGIKYTSAEQRSFLLKNYQGCDSLVNLELTIKHSNVVMDTVLWCGPFKWMNGIHYENPSSTGSHKLVNSQGCDSLLKLVITIPETLSYKVIYPNPTFDEFKFNLEPLEIKQIELFTSTGQKAPLNVNDGIVQLPQAPGLYLLRVFTDCGLYNYKVLRL